MTDGNDLAFPLVIPEHVSVGLTKREYFAAMAMQGFLSSGESVAICKSAGWIAATAVDQADELIKALNK